MKFGHFTAGDVASLMHYIRNWAVLTAILDMLAKKFRVPAGNQTPVGEAVDIYSGSLLKVFVYKNIVKRDVCR